MCCSYFDSWFVFCSRVASLCVGRCLSFVVDCLGACCVLFVVCCLLDVVDCFLHGMNCCCL